MVHVVTFTKPGFLANKREFLKRGYSWGFACIQVTYRVLRTKSHSIVYTLAPAFCKCQVSTLAHYISETFVSRIPEYLVVRPNKSTPFIRDSLIAVHRIKIRSINFASRNTIQILLVLDYYLQIKSSL